MRLDVVTIFPEYLDPVKQSLLGKAQQAGLVDIRIHDLRGWTDDVHRTVDDSPYGGGGGMVMRPEVWGRALDEITTSNDPTEAEKPVLPRLIVPTPSGRRFDHAMAVEYAAQPWLIFACGRYEGIDYRVVEDAASRMPTDEVSIGDYVLAGGEAATLVMVEAISRLVPGVVGNAVSVAQDSFADGLLEGPVYTRPQRWRGRDVPEVLLSGDHAAIARWRTEQSLLRTAARRPDLLEAPATDG